MSAADELLEPGQAVDLTNCDREPIHIPGAIQPHGLLLTLTEPDYTVRQVSRNAETILGRDVQSIVGSPIAQLMPDASTTVLRELAAREPGGEIAVAPVELLCAGEPLRFELSLHRSEGLLVCELEPRDGASIPDAAIVAREVPDAMHGLEGVSQLFQRAADEVRQLTGYDRVMVYRFDEDGHGEVIGEARETRLDSLLGHHYPASDIPSQARALYARQTIRMIVDVDYEAAPIWPAENPLTGGPLDLGLAKLRSVSPIHLQYLRNMGVTATLTISLLRDEELWGLIACHHCAPHYVPYSVRSACRFIGELLSLQLDGQEDADLERERAGLLGTRARLLSGLKGAADLTTGLGAGGALLLELCAADGVSVLLDEGRVTAGEVPDAATEAQIVRHAPAGRPLVIDRLSRDLPFESRRTELSGVLALPLPRALGTHIVWYRDEWVHDLTWGGDPSASLRPDLTSMDVKSLSPRRSFEAFRQTVIGRSRPWRLAQVEAATELVEALARDHT